jgi:hypothetical protein
VGTDLTALDSGDLALLEIWTCNGQANQQWSWAYR